MTIFVLSTQTGSVSYCFFDKIGDLPVIRDKVTIHGGAHIPSLKSGFGEMSRDGEGHPLWTADGIVTPLREERYALLKEHWLFKKHQDEGRVKVLSEDITGNHKAVVRETRTMMKADEFAQLNPETLKEKVSSKLRIHEDKELSPEEDFRL